MNIIALPSFPSIRFDASQSPPTLSRFKSRRGEHVLIFVGEDQRSVWLELRRGHHTDTIKLSQALLSGIKEEAQRRNPHGLHQPHWGRVALEWIRQKKIDVDALVQQGAMNAVHA